MTPRFTNVLFHVKTCRYYAIQGLSENFFYRTQSIVISSFWPNDTFRRSKVLGHQRFKYKLTTSNTFLTSVKYSISLPPHMLQLIASLHMLHNNIWRKELKLVVLIVALLDIRTASLILRSLSIRAKIQCGYYLTWYRFIYDDIRDTYVTHFLFRIFITVTS